MPKSPQLPYFPGNIPNNPEILPTWLYDELYRIATAINAAPEGFSVEASGTIQFTNNTTVDTQLFIGETPNFDVPGGGWDSAAGTWTVQVTAVYNISGMITIQPIGGGNKDYLAALVLYRNGAEVFRTQFSQQDDYLLTCTLNFAYPVQAGDVFKLHCETYSEQQTATPAYEAYWNMIAT